MDLLCKVTAPLQGVTMREKLAFSPSNAHYPVFRSANMCCPNNLLSHYLSLFNAL